MIKAFGCCLCWLAAGSAFASSAMFDDVALVGNYHCRGWDAHAGDYTVNRFEVTLDQKVSRNNSLGYYSYQLTLTDSSLPGSYTGAMIINPLTGDGANFLGNNPENPGDAGPGVVTIDGLLGTGQVAKFSMTYYLPHYHENGAWSCIRQP